VDELIDAVGLADQRKQKVSTLSTGQRQKMNFVRGLLNDPWILFLDEPTLGLDVSAARAVRELIVAWKAVVPGRTVLLTSHYMAEVDELCERVAIVDRGRILAIGTPDELRRRVQRESIFRLELDGLDGGPGALQRLPGVVAASAAAGDETSGHADRQSVSINLVLTEDAALGGVVTALGGLGANILALRKSEPTLEDVFVELVGRGFDEAASDADGAGGAGTERSPEPTDADRPSATETDAVAEIDREEVGSR
jgi:ABC-2 type transport system ATP-binding protein